MLLEPTAPALPSASGGVARPWAAPAGWRQARAVWATLGQFVGARQATHGCEPDPFATEMPFLTDRWPAGE